MNVPPFRRLLAGFALSVVLTVSGCATTSLNGQPEAIASSDIPRELQQVTHPTYRVAAPDILLIEAVHNTRPPGDTLSVGDELSIRLGNPALSPLPAGAGPIEQQIWAQEQQSKFVDGNFTVQTNGSVNLGPAYGTVHVEGLTVAESQKAIREYLKRYLKNEDGTTSGIKDPQVSAILPNVTGKQVISGEHLVRPDGSVSLGVYGSVHVAGLTLDEVKTAVERHLGKSIHKPEINVDVLSYNSQVYYVITDGGGFGEQVVRLPCTGNETVLDAISNIDGLSEVSSKKIWVARPAPAGARYAQVMDVNWSEITREGITTTNYQILPGDRVYIAADHMIALDNFVAKVTAPFERIFGFILLGNGTVRSLQQGNGGGSGGSGSGGFGGGGSF